jgi:hypothetical protein
VPIFLIEGYVSNGELEPAQAPARAAVEHAALPHERIVEVVEPVLS